MGKEAASAGAGALVGGIGSALGAGQGGTSQTSNTQPWSAQQPYLTGLFSQAQQTEQARTAQGAYGGQYVAQQNPYQASGIGQGYTDSTASNQAGLNQQALGSGLQDTNGQNYSGNANALFANGQIAQSPWNAATLSNYSTGSGNGLSGALNSAAISGAQSIGNAQGTLSQVGQQALSDPTQRLTSDATSIMNSAPTQLAINSTDQGIAQQLNEQTVPGINQAAASNGSLNSSRAGAANAEAQGQAALATGSANSSILNNAFNQGLSTANSAYSTGLGAATNSAAASGSLGNSTALGTGSQQIGAANSALSNTLNYNQAGYNNDLNANAQIGNSASYGTGLVNYGTQNQTAANNLMNTAGSNQQAGLQAADTNSYDQYQGQNTYEQGVLQNYLSLIGGNYGQTGASTQTTASSPLGNVLGGASLGAGLYSQYGGGGSTLPNIGYGTTTF